MNHNDPALTDGRWFFYAYLSVIAIVLTIAAQIERYQDRPRSRRRAPPDRRYR